MDFEQELLLAQELDLVKWLAKDLGFQISRRAGYWEILVDVTRLPLYSQDVVVARCSTMWEAEAWLRGWQNRGWYEAQAQKEVTDAQQSMPRRLQS